MDVIRYLVTACECKYVFLDHITMIVTGQGDDGDERKKLDYISTRLAMMTKELNFTLFLVSHVNDENKTRGSRNIGKIADLIIHMDRDKENPSEEVRNMTRLIIKGNRFAHGSGPSGVLKFDTETYTLSEADGKVQDVRSSEEAFLDWPGTIPEIRGLPETLPSSRGNSEPVPTSSGLVQSLPPLPTQEPKGGDHAVTHSAEGRLDTKRSS
jgi:hypothetical protein